MAISVSLTLGLGIGANSAIFFLLDPLLLRKLPVVNPDELVSVTSSGTLGDAESSELSAFYTYRDKNRAFSGVLAFSDQADYTIVENGKKSAATGQIVSGNYFTLLGVPPYIGRVLTMDDEGTGGPAVVLSFEYWRRSFNSNRAILGTAVTINETPYAVIGVAAPSFFGTETGKSPDFYLPLRKEGAGRVDWVHIIARLAPGISIIQATDALEPAFQKVASESSVPEVERRELMARLSLTSASHGMSEIQRQFSLPVWILMAVVTVILVITCVNVANLLLVYGSSRVGELSVRQALGAGRERLVRQLLTESALLVIIGGMIGILLGVCTRSLLTALVSTSHLPIILAAPLKSHMLLFFICTFGLTLLLTGSVPAISLVRVNLVDQLRGRPAYRASERVRLRNMCIVGQVSLSVALLVVATLLIKSLVKLETFDTGFDRDHVLLVSVDGQASGRSPAQLKDFCNRAVERIRTVPGVLSASYSRFAPISGAEMGINVDVEGYVLSRGETANERFVGVSPGYFQTLGIPLLRGRDFGPQDVSDIPRVAIVNRAMSHRFFGENSPIGRRFKFVEGNRPPLEIIGVAADSKYNNLRESNMDFFYVPTSRGRTFEIRSGGDPKILAASVRGVIRSLDDSFTMSVRTLREEVDESIHLDRVVVTLCSAFSGLALTLACVGVFGSVSMSVRTRTTEIGIRIALGATQKNIVRLIMIQAMIVTFIGLLLGIGMGVWASSLLRSLLFEVRQFDLLSLLVSSLLLIVATGLASYIPARKAAGIEPLDALRSE
jgi:predicted permease